MYEKVFSIIIVVMLGFAIVACGSYLPPSGSRPEKQNTETKVNMPDIVFEFSYVYDSNEPYSYGFVFIDKSGNIYLGEGKEYFGTVLAVEESAYDNC